MDTLYDFADEANCVLQVGTELTWEPIRSALNIGGKSPVREAISSIGIALWDIFGKEIENYLLGGRASRRRRPSSLDRCRTEAWGAAVRYPDARGERS